MIHESALPLGKGWSPVSWQILEGKSIIPITLFEADMEVDSGVIYFQEHIELDGYELVDEIRQKQGLATIHLALKFVDGYNSLTSKHKKENLLIIQEEHRKTASWMSIKQLSNNSTC